MGDSSVERWDKRNGELPSSSIIGAGHIAPTDTNLSANIGTFPEGFHKVFKGPVQSGFLTPNQQQQPIQTDPRCWATATGPFVASLLWLMDQKKAGSDQSFVIKFVVPI